MKVGEEEWRPKKSRTGFNFHWRIPTSPMPSSIAI